MSMEAPGVPSTEADQKNDEVPCFEVVQYLAQHERALPNVRCSEANFWKSAINTSVAFRVLYS